jgi:amino-acid N-acetyltransferase
LIGSSILTRFSLRTLVAADKIAIRKATSADTAGIADLVNLGEREGQLLPRTIESIERDIDNWVVAEEAGQIVGVGSLVEMNPNLVEVRSLAVAPTHRKHGLGAKIVNALVEEAQARGIATVFALTRAVLFFEKLGFKITEKENFPEKVWRDCSVCPVQFACDEVALVKSLGGGQ